MEAIRYDATHVSLLDQTRLPHEEVWHTYTNAESVAEAIRAMQVRGAPAIAVAACFGLALDARRLLSQVGEGHLKEQLRKSATTLRNARPTAVNLGWAMDRMERVIDATASEQVVNALHEEALQIAKEDLETNRRIGRNGLDLFKQSKVRILTHCNTGSLATVGYGTALGVIRALHENGQIDHVYVDETRPYLQGARLTAFELMHEQIPFDIITDSMAGYVMQQGLVDAVIVGADRVAENGDTANKIGTYSLAVLAKYHGVPFYVAAPVSTIDLKTLTGQEIPIEQRSAKEVTELNGVKLAPAGSTAIHPAFDVTPGELISGIITERFVVTAPYVENLRACVEGE